MSRKFVPPWNVNCYIHGISFVYMPKDGIGYIIFDNIESRRDWEGVYPPLSDLPIMACGNTMCAVKTPNVFDVCRFKWFVCNVMATNPNTGERMSFRQAMYTSEVAARIECELHTNPMKLPMIRHIDEVCRMAWWPFAQPKLPADRGRYMYLDDE